MMVKSDDNQSAATVTPPEVIKSRCAGFTKRTAGRRPPRTSTTLPRSASNASGSELIQSRAVQPSGRMPIRALPSFNGAEKVSTPASDGGRSANCASAAASNGTPGINPAINGIAKVEVIHLHSIVRFYTEESSLRQTIPLFRGGS